MGFFRLKAQNLYQEQIRIIDIWVLLTVAIAKNLLWRKLQETVWPWKANNLMSTYFRAEWLKSLFLNKKCEVNNLKENTLGCVTKVGVVQKFNFCQRVNKRVATRGILLQSRTLSEDSKQCRERKLHLNMTIASTKESKLSLPRAEIIFRLSGLSTQTTIVK